ncbi:MAG: TolC family protein [Planctomycetota bacterium]
MGSFLKILTLNLVMIVSIGIAARALCGEGERAEILVEQTNSAVQSDRQVRLKHAIDNRTSRPEVTVSALKDVKDLTKLSLSDAISIATKYNRDYAGERDNNTQTALSYIQTRHRYDPHLSGVLGVLGSNTPSARALTATGSFGVDVETELSTHLNLTLNTSGNATLRPGSDSYSSSALFTLTQPLLKGFGKTVAREPLTQAERNMTYRLRSFELFREDFTIEVIRQFYNLLREVQVVENNKQRFAQSDFQYRRAQALFKIGRQSELDVLSAEQERLQAENDFRDATESHKDSLLTFKTFLGIPDNVPLDIRTDELPKLVPAQLNAELAIRLAVENRLDLANLEDQLADAERGIAITQNSLLPELNFQLTAGTQAQSRQFVNQQFKDRSATAGLTMVLPLDKVNEKVNARQAELNLDRARRVTSLFRDNLAAEVRRLLRNLTRIEQSMEVQKKILVTSEKRLAYAETLFRKGVKTSRDVTDAQQALLKARNDNIQFIVDHAIADLQLRRSLGVLDLQANGIPKERNLADLTADETDAAPKEN